MASGPIVRGKCFSHWAVLLEPVPLTFTFICITEVSSVFFIVVSKDMQNNLNQVLYFYLFVYFNLAHIRRISACGCEGGIEESSLSYDI